MTAQLDLVSATVVVDRVPGLTYRVLDYWVRCGQVRCTVEARGSGTRRLFEPDVIPEFCRLMQAREFLGPGQGTGYGKKADGGYSFTALTRVADLLDEVAALRPVSAS